jgi:RimJ/RimL family protein N-acetyltransferase
METLETARLLIRPFTMDDLEEVHRLLDLDIQWAGPGFPLERRRERLQLQVGRVFAITDRANNDSVRLMQRVGMRIARNPDPDVTYPAVVGVIERPGGGAP